MLIILTIANGLQIPCVFIFLTGLFMYLNFAPFASSSLLDITYYPAILIAIMTGIIFFPFPVLYHKGRRWLLYSMVSSFLIAKIRTLLTSAVAFTTCWHIPR